MFGDLKAETQTYIEDEIGSKLMPPVGGRAAKLAEVRTLAQAHEVREVNRADDMTRMLVRLGIPVKKQKAQAAAKPMAGRPSDEDDDNEEWPDDDNEEWPDDDDEAWPDDNEAWPDDDEEWRDDDDTDGNGDNANADSKKEEKISKSSGNLDVDALFTAIAAVTDSDAAATMKQRYERALARNTANGV